MWTGGPSSPCIVRFGLIHCLRVIRRAVARPGWEASMLDGSRYFAEFPDEDPAGGRIPLSSEQLTTLAAIEREISGFIGAAAGPNASAIAPFNLTDE